jgi:hypothetical protein
MPRQRNNAGSATAAADPRQDTPIFDPTDLLDALSRARSAAFALRLRNTEVTLRRALIALSREANLLNSLSPDEQCFVEALPRETLVPGVGIRASEWSKVEKAVRMRGGYHGS